MTIYIDKLRNWGWKNHGKNMGPSCHLISDQPPTAHGPNNTELHNFALTIGLLHTWYQKHPQPHYDLTTTKRQLALQKGATELQDRPFHNILKQWRQQAITLIQNIPPGPNQETEQNKIRTQLYT